MIRHTKTPLPSGQPLTAERWPLLRTAVAGTGLALLLAACGGGDAPPAPSSAASPPLPSSVYAERCAPDNPDAPPPQRTGSRATEMAWLRAMLQERYLWSEDLPALDLRDVRYQGTPGAPVDHATAMDRWFGDLIRPGGSTDRDPFSYRVNVTAAQASMAGEEAGWGLNVVALPTEPPRVFVTWVDPQGPAAGSGLRRGDELLALDDAPLVSSDPALRQKMEERLQGPAVGDSATFTVQRPEGPLTRRLVAARFDTQPVPLVSVLGAEQGQTEPVGYMLFNDFNAPAQAALKQAFEQLAAAQVRDLVLDLRYNPGGLGFIASQLAYMVAGSSTTGKTFNQPRRNAARMATAASDVMPFLTKTCEEGDERCERGQPLPSLQLRRLFVLTGPGTCSASELLINGLRGVDVEVVQIGGTTCGKPYGFEGVNNCGSATFAIEVQARNAKGFGDYTAGFQPGGNGPTGLPGCEALDDLTHALGDPAEGLLATALSFRATGQCPSQAAPLQGARASAASAFRPLRRPAALDLSKPGASVRPR
ncbi:S41 family peptidase [Roseateles depolymerans]|uniref:Peptidase S41 n=1 Tax=Roseateles depolymerans TaxID=76731 RepID=A0A0U3N8F6_9BURK|nr:S41 family peptidase [Roseateles depolymerans]ALV04848.1 Peptidase S41 [Roseateles depolymerans]REG15140.1 PDZ domain-containing protein [Roseateles depolymerans]